MRRSPVPAAHRPRAIRIAWSASFLLTLALIALLGMARSSQAGTVESPVIDTAVTSGPSEGATTEAARPVFTFSATENGSPLATATFHCAVDGGPVAACPTPFQAGPLGNGAHKLSVYAENSGGFRDTTPAVRNFTVEAGEEGEEAEEGGEETSPYPPEECKLRSARARLFTYTSQQSVRLVIRYTSFAPAKVTVDFRLRGRQGGMKLGSAKRRFSKRGVFRRTESLSAAGMRKVRAAKEFVVAMQIPGTPRYCRRYYTRHLTIRRTIHGQVVWFQSDSIFGS